MLFIWKPKHNLIYSTLYVKFVFDSSPVLVWSAHNWKQFSKKLFYFFISSVYLGKKEASLQTAAWPFLKSSPTIAASPSFVRQDRTLRIRRTPEKLSLISNVSTVLFVKQDRTRNFSFLRNRCSGPTILHPRTAPEIRTAKWQRGIRLQCSLFRASGHCTMDISFRFDSESQHHDKGQSTFLAFVGYWDKWNFEFAPTAQDFFYKGILKRR